MSSEPKPLNRALIVIATIADISALCSLSAQLLRQDLFLVVAIAVILIGFGLLLWKVLQLSWIDRQNLAAIGIFFLASIVFAIISWVLLSNVKVTPIHIEIAEPQDGVTIE